MIKSMTGFGAGQKEIRGYGRISLELRSTNHRFLDIVCHLPEGFLGLQEQIKKEIAAKIRRGRLTCVLTPLALEPKRVFIDKNLLKEYLSELKMVKKEINLNDTLNIETLIHLPGVLSIKEPGLSDDKKRFWSLLKELLNQVLEDLIKMRQKEGKALYVYLNKRIQNIQLILKKLERIFNEKIKLKLLKFRTDEERVNFLKQVDISEELDRLSFHARNFKKSLLKNGSVGKELDFIAQEMQREANTLAAKSFDGEISRRIIKIKTQIEKIREQVQNIE
ncbi:MAG: YicC family protein [Candidatus Omnitrophica bacterium]|nr:YicC family protein [Candidatus Omnitrophota bacterium]